MNFSDIQDLDLEKIQSDIDESNIDGMCLEPQVMYLTETGEEVFVYGDPYEIGKKLDDNQGDNVYGYGQNCGLVSIHNLLTMAGIVSTEDEVVGRAIIYNQCITSSPNFADNGGTTVYMRQNLLQTYGISSSIFWGNTKEGSLESIASYVEAGYGVNISGNSGYLWGDPNYIRDGKSNHSVIVTGTVRNSETGELKGLFICDSGKPGESSSVYLSVETLKDAYLNAKGSAVLVTNNPIR